MGKSTSSVRAALLAFCFASAVVLAGCAQLSLPLEQLVAPTADTPAAGASASPEVEPTATAESAPAESATAERTSEEVPTVAGENQAAATEEPIAEAPATGQPRTAEVATPTVEPTLAVTVTVEATAPAPTATGESASAGFVLPTPTPQPLFMLPTPTPRLPEVTPAVLPSSTEPAAPVARIRNSINVRSGPGTNYPVIAGLAPDARVEIVGRNSAGDWWQVAHADNATGWISAPLVDVEGDVALIAVPVNIPTPPPTNTPAPLAPPASTAVPDEAAPAPTAAAPVAEATGTVFRVINKRLWDVYENGGSLDFDSVTCGEKRQLVVTVLDENGIRLNGVAVQAIYGAQEIFYTGSQGLGDGNVEFVLGGGQDVKIIRDTDGSPANSEVATGLSTNPAAIPFDQLIAAQYCTDAASCQRFVDAPGCYGHFSWTVTFQRNR